MLFSCVKNKFPSTQHCCLSLMACFVFPAFHIIGVHMQVVGDIDKKLAYK